MEAKEVKRVEIASFALSMAVVHAIIGLFAGIVIAICFAAFLPDVPMFVNVLFIFIYPVIGFIGGFLGGAVYAAIYNYLSERYTGTRFKAEAGK